MGRERGEQRLRIDLADTDTDTDAGTGTDTDVETDVDLDAAEHHTPAPGPGPAQAASVHPGERPASGTDVSGGWGSVRARLGGWSRARRATALAAGLALVSGAALGASALTDRARDARLRAAAGGVVLLAEPLDETWQRDLGAGDVLGLATAVVVVDDGVVRALDPRTGAVRWSQSLGDGSWCRVSDDGSAGEERLSCVTPQGGAPQDGSSGGVPAVLTVVTAQGEVVGTRRVRATGPVVPGPEGTLLRLTRVGPAPQGPACTPDGCVAEGAVVDGRDLEVRAEDLLTGDVRWTSVLPFDPSTTGLDSCLEPTETGLRNAPSTASAWADGRVVTVSGCGVRAAFTADGERLDAGEWRGVEPLGDSGYVVRGSLRDTAVAADGTRRELPGRLLVPTAADGSVSDLRLVDEGARLRAEDDDGRELWTVRRVSNRVLVLAGGVALVDDGAGNLTALDLGTGRGLWGPTRLDTAAGLDITGWSPTIGQAFTDGRRALLTLEGVPDARRAVVTHVVVDLRSGEVQWHAVREGWETLLAVDGRLVGFTSEAVTGLG